MTNTTTNRNDLRRRLIDAERINRDIADAELDIDIAVDAILNGEVDINAAEAIDGEPFADDTDRLINACILTDGRWWVR